MTKLPMDFLEEWAGEVAALSGGTVSHSELFTAALLAEDAGKDLKDPAVRKAVIAKASARTSTRESV